MADSNSQSTSGKESFLFKYLLSSTAAAVAETGVDFDVQKWNKKEVDDYVSSKLLEIEKGEKELEEKEKWLKEMDAPKFIQTGQETINESSASDLKLEKEVHKENNSECDLFQTYDNWQEWNSISSDFKSQRGLGIDGKEYEERKKKLAEIRKADYNDYLKKKNSVELKIKKDNRQYNQTSEDECANEHFGKSKSSHFDSNEKSSYQISSDIFPAQHNTLPSTLNKNEYKNASYGGVDCQQSVCSISKKCSENLSALNSDNSSLRSTQSVRQKASFIVSPSLHNSDARREIAALYKEQLDKQIAEKQKLQSLHREYAELCEKKNDIRAMQQIMRMQEEYVDELKKHDKIKAAFKLQEERCKKLEEFIKNDSTLKKPKFKNYKTAESDKHSQLLVCDLDNLSISNVLSNLSDIRQKAIKTQRMLDEEINRRQRKKSLNQ